MKKVLDKLTNLLFFLSILFFTVGLNLQDNPPSGWYQQFLPYIDNKPITDMHFLDSLTGLLCTADGTVNDTNYILKTTNGGDNWQVIYYSSYMDFSQMLFLNDSVGFVCGTRILKTTNRGDNWFMINGPIGATPQSMYALNEDTIWITDRTVFDGGIFRTTNGGLNWTRLTPDVEPLEIYMLDFNTGFYADNTWMRKTTNGGANWHIVSVTFDDIYFINENTGWHCEDVSNIYKTTNAGENWEILPLPPVNDSIIISSLDDFSVLNEDTIWGGGPHIFFGAGQGRGLIYITTDGGNTWGYQLPDTSIHIDRYTLMNFSNKIYGWAYRNIINQGVHTVTGGDTTIMLGIEHVSNEIPKGFTLHQNYPNPFNPVTTITYELKFKGDVKLTVYDVTGKWIKELVNQFQSPGVYKYTFNGTGLPSGVYFYQIRVHPEVSGKEDFIDSRKMLLIK